MENNPIVTITMEDGGKIVAELYPDVAPQSVYNFISLIKKGFYNGLIFHRCIYGFMIQGGDPLGKGIGGESIWGRPFKDEFSRDYHNLRGALCMANAGPNTNGSQFFIVQAPSVDERFIPQMERLPDMFTDESIEDYKAVGGTPWLDFRHTVFGQVFEGMDVVDAIASVDRDSSDKPLEDVVINSVETQTL